MVVDLCMAATMDGQLAWRPAWLGPASHFVPTQHQIAPPTLVRVSPFNGAATVQLRRRSDVICAQSRSGVAPISCKMRLKHGSIAALLPAVLAAAVPIR